MTPDKALVVLEEAICSLRIRDAIYGHVRSPAVKEAIKEYTKAIELTRQAIAEQIERSKWLEQLRALKLLDRRIVFKITEHPAQTILTEGLIFVVISFSPDMEPVFEGIQAAGRAFGLEVKRVKDIMGDYRITEKILDLIAGCRLVVADLTHERPNVYFELGYARGLGKTVITTAREGTSVHFDVRDWTCLFYTDSRTLERSLREVLAITMSGAASRDEMASSRTT